MAADAGESGPTRLSVSHRVSATAPLRPAGRLAALLVPWTFVLVFSALYVWLLLPRVLEGHLLGVFVGVFVAFTLAVSTLAALTFSRDILTGRWP
jgi:hypothetical protein